MPISSPDLAAVANSAEVALQKLAGNNPIVSSSNHIHDAISNLAFALGVQHLSNGLNELSNEYNAPAGTLFTEDPLFRYYAPLPPEEIADDNAEVLPQPHTFTAERAVAVFATSICVSQASILAETHVSRPTVSGLVKEFGEGGLIQIVSKQDIKELSAHERNALGEVRTAKVYKRTTQLDKVVAESPEIQMAINRREVLKTIANNAGLQAFIMYATEQARNA